MLLRVLVLLTLIVKTCLSASANDYLIDEKFLKYSGLTPYNITSSITQTSFEKEFLEVWKLVQDDFLYPERLTSWSKWVSAYKNKILDKNSEKTALKNMLESLKDDYTLVKDDEKVKENTQCVNQNFEIKLLTNHVLYIKIYDFSQDSLNEMLIAKIKHIKNYKNVILDLRDNPGGCVDIAFKTFNLFASSGLFVDMVGFKNGIRQKDELILEDDKNKSVEGLSIMFYKRLPYLTKGKNMVVLINDQTMSAAEMLAGALKYNNCAKLIGQKSFGKGVIQRVWNLNNHLRLKITSQFYYLPNGASIHGVGLRPDYSVENNKNGDNQLSFAMNYFNH